MQTKHTEWLLLKNLLLLTHPFKSLFKQNEKLFSVQIIPSNWRKTPIIDGKTNLIDESLSNEIAQQIDFHVK